ncbi:MAG: MFS transporter [Alphaproteobacteria bacterium]|nr:MAG: MFS transporter [Alphaproteobacteria bacterium]
MPVILLTVFIDLLGFGLIVPLLPFLTLKYGGSALDGTALMSIYSLMAFASGPLWGRFSDRFGRRPALIATLLGAAISYVALALSDSILMLYVARAMSGMMAGNIGIVTAIAADLSDEKDRGKTMGKIGAMFGLGFAFGPVIGGFAGSLGGGANILLPGLMAAALSFIAAALAFYFVAETNKEKHVATEKADSTPPHWTQVLKAPGQLALLAIFIVTAVAQSTSFSITPFWADAVLGWDERDVGSFYSLVGVATVGIQWFLIGPMFRVLGEVRSLMYGAMVHVAGSLIMISTPTTVPLAGLGLLMVMCGLSLAFPALNSLMSRRSDRRLQGTGLGLANGLSALGRVIGPASAGLLFAALTPERPFIQVGVAGVIVLIWAAFEIRRERA